MRNQNNRLDELKYSFTSHLLELLDKKVSKGQMTYGFEFEFIATKPLDLNIMEILYGYLPKCGFLLKGKLFTHPSGTYVTFEPGGQIEYHSLPLHAEDDQIVHGIIDLMEETNFNIKSNKVTVVPYGINNIVFKSKVTRILVSNMLPPDIFRAGPIHLYV